MTLEELVAYFPDAKPTKNGYKMRCPAHDDRNPSLGIGRGDNGGLVMCCQAGCTNADILAAKGLTLKDLAPPTNGHYATNGRQWGEIVAVYRYDDERGEPLYEVCRTADKQFPQRLPGATKWGIGETRRVLFGLPELLASKEGDVIGIAEGEKDVLNLRRAGLVATSNPGGADRDGRKWREEYTLWLKTQLPGRKFLIFADQDEAGIGHAGAVYHSLVRAGCPVRTLDLEGLKRGEDISDWLARHSQAEFDALIRPPPHPLVLRLLSRDALRNLPPPSWQIEGVFYEQSIVEVYGESNHGKSLVGMDIGLNLVRGGVWADRCIVTAGAVLYVNADGGPGFSPRLRAWELANGTDAAYEFWTYPMELLIADDRQMAEFTEGLAHLPEPPAMIVIDTLSQCIPGVNENQQEDMSRVIAHFNAIKRQYGTTIMLLHHVGKDGLNRGSTVIPGAADTIIRVTQQPGDLVELRCDKQRDGRKFPPIYFQIRPHGNEEGVYLEHTEEPGPSVTGREEREQQVVDALQDAGGWLTRDEIKLRVRDVSAASIYRYLKKLMGEGLVMEDERPNPLGRDAKVYLYTQPREGLLG